ncbi:hypothetical protein Vadar_028232 [Vaccinium darrowii]|uniref:Uncharacterized protein n=1 Tax=Vaccinium darrowii TaxID=229202 RepID=A0ACB7YA33_9ERIC|nr:hypothetical protein Vadar_028232 [Vaccinium darrowii]
MGSEGGMLHMPSHMVPHDLLSHVVLHRLSSQRFHHMIHHQIHSHNWWRKIWTSEMNWRMILKLALESKFEFPEDERMRDKIKHDTLKSLGDKLRQWRCSLKSQHYDPSKTAAQIVAAAPATVNRDHYAELVDFWFSKEGKTLSDNNKKCRGENKVPHTAGSKTYSQHAYDLGEKTGVGVDRAEMYKLTHEKSGIPVNDIASENIVQDGVSGARDQASPQTHQGSSFGSHEIEPRGMGVHFSFG